MPDPLLLKKYSNRRLYDTRNSRYVTLEDVAQMIRSGEHVQIQDVSTGDDVTALTLTQIVLEAARRKNSLLPEPVLHLIIRYGDNALGEFFERYFQKTIHNYLASKAAFDQQFGQWLDMGLDISRRMPEMMAGPSAINAMMEIFGYQPSSAPESTETGPSEPTPSPDDEPEPKP